MGFDGFISYSHAADGRLAPAVQRGLQALAKPWHRRRALWIFRDQTGLAVTPALWTSITKALDSSEYFVLMASPEAAKSPWVNKEIEHWVATKSPDRILPVVTDGEWRWDTERGDFAADSTAVPAALRGAFTEEPLYLDLRWARDEGQLSLRHSRFRDGIAQLAAPMHGISKDDLEGEDVRQHRRARRLWSVAIASLALLTLVASLTGVLAVRNADRANASAAEAVRQQLRASQQEVNADRSAVEASHQLENARVQEAQAKAAVKETRRQQKRAEEQRELADRASADAARQQANARRQAASAREQQLAAERAAKRAREQEALARRQTELAKSAAAESREQKKIAEEQARLARDAKEEAEWQRQAAELQKQLAGEAAAEARRQEESSPSYAPTPPGRRAPSPAAASPRRNGTATSPNCRTSPPVPADHLSRLIDQQSDRSPGCRVDGRNRGPGRTGPASVSSWCFFRSTSLRTGVAMRFGVTGHQVLPPRIVDCVLEHWSRVLPAGAQLCGVSSLAEGADQLFAAHVLAAGGMLEAILPCEDYAGSLVTDDGRARFEELRRAAGTVITLPYPKPTDQAFLAAGQALVDRSDHLFAVWDGRPARGVGGTADIVAYARARGRPVTVLWVDGVLRA